MPAPSHPLPPGGAIDPAVTRGIRQASAATQVDFSFLLATATQESGLKADAKSSKGTATGLFQFIDSTWLQMVQRFGAKYGIGDLAQQISVDEGGHAHVADPAVRQQILDLRKDPALSASLAAEYAKTNKSEVERALGRPAGSTDLYMAHFLGAGGATEFLKAVQHDGNAVAADLLPEAAASNRGVFYDSSTGAPRTVAEIYRTFAQQLTRNVQAAGATTGDLGIAPGGSSAGASFKTFLAQVGLGGGLLTDPIRSMLDALAASALRLLRGDQYEKSTGDTALLSITPASPAAPGATTDRHRESHDI